MISIDVQIHCVQEGIIRKLNQHLGWGPAPVEGEVGETVWSLMHADPSLTGREVADMVLTRFQMQEAGGNVDDVVDVLDDCFLPADQEKILRAVAARNEQSRVATEMRSTTLSTYERVLKGLPADVRKAGEAQRKKKLEAESKEQKSKDREIGRFYSKVGQDVESVWKAALPSKAHAYTDSYNGRWRLSYKTNGPTCARSISWTTKGTKQAASEARTTD